MSRAIADTREDLDARREQAQKMEAVGQLAGGVAHDFNNWLTAIRGYTETILDELDETNSLRHPVEGIRAAAEGAASLTRQLLAFGRRQMLLPRVLDLGAVVDGMSDMIRSVLGEGIELVVAADPDLGHVKVDDGQVKQVILNLVINARDAMPEGGKLSIKLENVDFDSGHRAAEFDWAAEQYVKLSVRDTGAGMTPDVACRIFEPFFTTKEAGYGTGLGLATVYGIVKQSNGSIWVDTREGAGSTFTIVLPRVDEAVSIAAPSSRLEVRGGRETILLVEDKNEVRDVVASMLRRKGYGVLAARSSEEAVTIAGEHEGPIDLLLTDVVMPGVNGVQLATEIVTSRPGMRVLYISGYADEEIISHGVVDLNRALLPKPFDGEELAGRVRDLLDGELATR
jgi:nitrogen-specific signal transduction histidine kinase/CheY-like chemotaxis protein